MPRYIQAPNLEAAKKLLRADEILWEFVEQEFPGTYPYLAASDEDGLDKEDKLRRRKEQRKIKRQRI